MKKIKEIKDTLNCHMLQKIPSNLNENPKPNPQCTAKARTPADNYFNTNININNDPKTTE